MDVFALFSARVANAMHVLYPEVGADLLARIVVEPPRDAAHGDLSPTAATVVAKPLGKNPRDIANALVDPSTHDSDVASVEVAGPGFINFRLEAPSGHQVLRAVAEQGADYGRSTLGGGAAVNIEYVSANPT